MWKRIPYRIKKKKEIKHPSWHLMKIWSHDQKLCALVTFDNQQFPPQINWLTIRKKDATRRILAISSKNNFSVTWFGNFQQQLHSLLRAKQEADKFRRWTWFLFSHGNIEWIRSWHLKLPFFHMYSSTQQGRMLFTCFLYWNYFGLILCLYEAAGGRDIHPLTVNLFYTCSVHTYPQSKNCTREPAG